MKRILITGGAGFIGSHLAKTLAQAGHSVTIVDLNSSDQPLPGVQAIRGDVRSQADLVPLIKNTDVVFHWAAIVSVPECQNDPLGSYETNTHSTLKILDLIRAENETRDAARKIRMIFSSSSAVYGAQSHEGVLSGPISERIPLPDPLSFYGGQKLASEQLIRLYARTYHLPSVIFRFFNVYGPGQKASSPYSGVISVFSKAVKIQEQLRLNGGGNQTRDFVSVHDIVRACQAALASDNLSLLSGSPVNLGTGKAITIRHLAETLFELVGLNPQTQKVLVAPPRAGDIQHSLADVTRAREILGWTAKVALRDGLRELLTGI
ncbi:MAG: GDP-mannose 4,6-dehydratase [Oligoflexia bacterium]|nr:GDP-mannose 4,6-dehydratase [Oligoflexia bacterium]